MRKANDQFHQQVVPALAPSSQKKSAPKVIKEVPAGGGDVEGTKYTVTMTIDEMKNFAKSTSKTRRLRQRLQLARLRLCRQRKELVPPRRE